MDLVEKPSKKDVLGEHWLRGSLAYQREKLTFAKQPLRMLSLPSSPKKAQLPVTSKAGGLWGACGLWTQVKCFILKHSASAGETSVFQNAHDLLVFEDAYPWNRKSRNLDLSREQNGIHLMMKWKVIETDLGFCLPGGLVTREVALFPKPFVEVLPPL